MESPGIKRKSFGWTIEDAISCCVCFEFLSVPVFQCLNGHIICSACLDKLGPAKCPLCRAGLNQEVKNKLMDKVLGCYQKLCKFEGCNKFVSITNIESHQWNCSFNNDVPCPVKWADRKLNGCCCSETFPLKRLDSHLKDVHLLNVEVYNRSVNLKFCDDLSSVDKHRKVVDCKYLAIGGRSVLCSVLGEGSYCTIIVVPLHKDEKITVRLSIKQGEHACVMEKNTHGLKSIFNCADFLLSYTACELYCIDNYLNCTIELV